MKKIRALGNKIFLWMVEMRIGSQRIHKRFEATEAAATKIYQELLEAKARASLGMTYQVATETPSIGAASAQFEQHMRRLGRNEKHLEDQTRNIRILREKVGDDFPIKLIRRQHIMEWQITRSSMSYRDKLPNCRTMNKCTDHLSAFFEWACGMGWIEVNPAAKLPRMKQSDPPLRAISWKEFELLAAKAWQKRPAFGLLVELLGETGARVNEIISATVAIVDTKTKTWRITVKGGRSVTRPAGPWMLKAAQGRLAHEPLCPREDGRAWSYGAVKDAFKRIPIAGTCFTAHYLRHGRGTWDIEAGVPLMAVKEKLAHRSAATTERYLRAANVLGAAVSKVKIHQRLVTIGDKPVDFKKIKPDQDRSKQIVEKSLKPSNDKELRHKPKPT